MFCLFFLFSFFFTLGKLGFSRKALIILQTETKDKHSQKCRWAVCSPQVLWDLQQMVAAQGLLPKLQVGMSTHHVVRVQCVGWKAFCSAAPALHTRKVKLMSSLRWNSYGNLWQFLSESWGNVLVICDSNSTRHDSSSVKMDWVNLL